jgi:predicted helicase
MDFKEYIREIDRLYHVGNTTEHSFRGTLATYLQSILKNFVVTNEPRRIDCGAPDYVITLKSIPVAFIEAKDINDRDLDGRREHKEQFARYKESLNRIIFTDYLDFHMYIDGEFADSVRIAETKGDHIVGMPENEAKFTEMILHLATEGRQRITSSTALARQMAGKAHLLAEAVLKTIKLDGEDSNTEMVNRLKTFRNYLIHDLKAEDFADIYAQTIVYGMFTARLYDQSPEDFSRQEAANLIPKSNPFLRKIFQSIAGYDIDGNIEWIVDDLASMFAATDAAKIMRNYGSDKRHSDPIVHFYEDFLAEYDPRLRKARGVWYTPAPVVKFIVKAVDEILQTEFNLPMGLADSSTIKVKRAIQQSKDKRTTDGMKHEEVDVHRVQILDPATGTGTFLAEVIQQVRDKFDGMEGMWPSYVKNSLIPRLHGFEILMASYTIAHLKLSLTLKNTGYESQSDKRLNVFLTNSLEEATPRAENLFDKWLSDEADAASLVKAQTPIMIAIGNPPYSISSQNSGEWITNLVGDYKKYLNERNIQPLSDDYIKFIRLGQYYINKNGEGILAYISNNGFLDGIIHRQMRKSLLEEFDKIYIVNLHGNSRRKETAPDGGPDENVFDIMQGVSINIFVKTKTEKKSIADVFYKDIYGERKHKYNALDNSSLKTTKWEKLDLVEPYWFFVPKDFSAEMEYKKGFALDELFQLYKTGVATGKDDVLVNNDSYELAKKCHEFFNIELNKDKVRPYCYRPFDLRFIYYDTAVVQRHREPLMRHLQQHNIALISTSQNRQLSTHYNFAVNHIVDRHYLDSSADSAGVFPLYVYQNEQRLINLNKSILEKLESITGTVPEIEIFDYIYATLWSPQYQKAFKEFLKIDFPRIPYPKDVDIFHRLASKGNELRMLHLMEKADSWKTGVEFRESGSDTVEKVVYDNGKVYINDTQFFNNVSELAWNFFIGGYQPAQKWLKDRKGRKLDWQEIMHYGRIIYALQETDRITKEIDEIGVV